MLRFQKQQINVVSLQVYVLNAYSGDDDNEINMEAIWFSLAFALMHLIIESVIKN